MAQNYLDDDGKLVVCPAYVTLDGDFTAEQLRELVTKLEAADAANQPQATE